MQHFSCADIDDLKIRIYTKTIYGATIALHDIGLDAWFYEKNNWASVMEVDQFAIGMTFASSEQANFQIFNIPVESDNIEDFLQILSQEVQFEWLRADKIWFRIRHNGTVIGFGRILKSDNSIKFEWISEPSMDDISSIETLSFSQLAKLTSSRSISNDLFTLEPYIPRNSW